MRITDLLDKRSINLNAAPKTKSEALDGCRTYGKERKD